MPGAMAITTISALYHLRKLMRIFRIASREFPLIPTYHKWPLFIPSHNPNEAVSLPESDRSMDIRGFKAAQDPENHGSLLPRISNGFLPIISVHPLHCFISPPYSRISKIIEFSWSAFCNCVSRLRFFSHQHLMFFLVPVGDR